LSALFIEYAPLALYAATVFLSLWAAVLYGPWAWKLRGDLAAMPIALLVVGHFIDRLGVIAQDGYWGVARLLDLLGVIDRGPWLWVFGSLTKGLFVVSCAVSIICYYRARALSDEAADLELERTR
jgi:hypothetical protein